uniref:G_PROTEIN_RECEP_F1_2 domain-containing protein n=1 Tax=Ascaris lumbricoides TaxID=6252 RepID=A0A0M3II55_ASCLU
MLSKGQKTFRTLASSNILVSSATPPTTGAIMEIGPLLEGRPFTHLSSDYIQLFLYTIFVVIGLPINITTLIYMLRRYRHAKSLLLLLHINLNISNILVLMFFCTGYISWMITYEWLGGSVLCVAMRFMDEFVFSIK